MTAIGSAHWNHPTRPGHHAPMTNQHPALALIAIIALVQPACAPADGGSAVDVGTADASPTDAALPDVALPDVALPDAAPTDASAPEFGLDAAPDAAPLDAQLDAAPDASPDPGPPPLACPDPAAMLAAFYAEHGGPDPFTAHYRAALEGFLHAEAEVCRGEAAAARDRLDAIWARYPIGDPIWYRAGSTARGTNVGNPVAYYALRMLDEVVDEALRVDRPAEPPAPATATLTVVLVGCSQGIQPRTWAELEAGGGVEVRHAFDDVLRRDDHALLRASLDLFARYVFAMTRGHLQLAVRYAWLPDTCVPVSANAEPYRRASIDTPAPAFAALPDAIRETTDWWMVVYPSHVPEQHPDFEGVEFISGGMGLHADGGPVFLADDRWFIRKPPHLGDGIYTDAERRAYLPQWLQHEFYHHLFRLYPEHGLEAVSHQWFDRDTWPDDFEGIMEPDYYAEALHKRMWQGEPPLHARLRYSGPSGDIWDAITLDDVLGTYARQPPQNPWHTGEIERDGDALRWRNTAGVSWSLRDALDDGRLLGGPDNPYADQGDVDFHLQLAPDDAGGWRAEVTGFRFLGELYVRQ